MTMIYRSRPVQLEARGWDGSMPAGLDLVTWVRANGGQAHLNTRSGGRPVIEVWHGTEQTMKPDEDYLVRDQADGRFQVVPVRDIVERFDAAGGDMWRSRPVQFEAWDWDGGFKAGVDLVTRVRNSGGKAHLDSRPGGRPSIIIGDSDEMVPDLDVLLRDEAGHFFVRDRRAVEAELVRHEPANL